MSLQGTIETFAIADVLRLLAATSKSGRLQVQGPDRSGTVWVDGGKVLAAESPNTPHAEQVSDVLFQLVRFDRGSFSFELDRHPPQAGEPVDIEAALGEAESMVAEWREIERRVPSARAWVGLRSELPDSSVTISAEQWRVVQAVGGGRSVEGIGDVLGLAELPALRAVDQLLALGLVDVVTEPPEAGSDGAVTSAGSSVAPAAEAGPDPGAGSGSGATAVGDDAPTLTAGEGEARRRLDALAGAYGLPATPAPEHTPAPSVASPAEAPAAEAPAAAARVAPPSEPFPTDNHSGVAPHGDPLAPAGHSGVDVGDSGRAAPPPLPGYDEGGYGQPGTYAEYDQGAYSAYGEYGQQAQPGYGQAQAGGYGTPPPAPAGTGDGGFYGDSARAEANPPSADTGWAPPAPATALAPEWTTGRTEPSDSGGGTVGAGDSGGWPPEGVARARTIFESSTPPPPPPPPAPSGGAFGSGTQWYDSGPERIAPPPPPPPPVGGSANGADVAAGGSGSASASGADDEASSLERQLQNLSPKAQEAIKRSSGLFEGRSPN